MSRPDDCREYVTLPVTLLPVDGETRHGQDDVEALAASFGRVGILHPLVVADRKTCRVIAGRGRLAAARRAGLTHVPVMVAPDLDTEGRRLQAMLDENVCRKALVPSEIAALDEKLRPIVEAEARERQAATQAKPGQRVGSAPKGAPQSGTPKGRSDGTIGKALGVGRETLRKTRILKRAARENPALYGGLLELADKRCVEAAWQEYERLQAHQASHVGKPANEGKAMAPPPLKPLNIRSNSSAAKRIAEAIQDDADWTELLRMIARVREHVEARLADPNGLTEERHAELVGAVRPLGELLGGHWA